MSASRRHWTHPPPLPPRPKKTTENYEKVALIFLVSCTWGNVSLFAPNGFKTQRSFFVPQHSASRQRKEATWEEVRWQRRTGSHPFNNMRTSMLFFIIARISPDVSHPPVFSESSPCCFIYSRLTSELTRNKISTARLPENQMYTQITICIKGKQATSKNRWTDDEGLLWARAMCETDVCLRHRS